jgi:septal ring factor EnvC (AmiA/AmiB activator)
MSDYNTPALDAWNAKVSTPEKMARERERLYEKTRHDETSALNHARREAEKQEREKWQSVVATKDKTLAEKDKSLAEKDAENERLRKLIAELQGSV